MCIGQYIDPSPQAKGFELDEHGWKQTAVALFLQQLHEEALQEPQRHSGRLALLHRPPAALHGV